ncbi:Biopolymer transport protein ExbD [Rosistilla oblonga]|uniref:Biopolymer transport protein ExbD n=2 Tax=Rosistilla TaxID=2795779 RepID=A0A518ITD6_9BACT|nr:MULTISPECIES: biopolymer transporter ExbD [Rosistilla]QDS88247.1 Biopolymer transport protein ExbD [Rosistilla ulvae]QDV12314.1 Biopolymer transport protein ExbD [Rosistilla oblonga]QDV56354.1 Biopolymer transport protein ExbD [Rosistilla oblonga]
MAYQRRSGEEATINLTPMIDVVFLLVIFFMVGAKFTDQEGSIKVNVPGVGNLQSITRGPDQRVVDVLADGSLLLDKNPVAINQLQQTLTSAAAQYADTSVVVRGDGQGNFQAIAEVLQVVRQAGITDMGIAVRMQR